MNFMQNVSLRFFAIMVSLGICRICCVSASLQPALFLYLGHDVYFYTLGQKSIFVHELHPSNWVRSDLTLISLVILAQKSFSLN